MADIELNLKGDAAAKLAQVDKGLDAVEKSAGELDTGLKKVGDSADKAGEKLKRASSPVTAEGFKSAAAAVVTLTAAMAAATVQGAISDERHQQAVRALGPAYAAVERATNGTVTAEQAWRAQQQLLQSGLPTTGRELASLTRAARDYARATGTETPAAIEALTQAMIAGDAGGLRRFGLSVRDGATRTEVFNGALRQLQHTQANAAPTARTLAEEVSHFGTTLTEAGGALAGFLSNALGVPDALEAVGGSVRRLTGNLTDFLAFQNQAHGNASTGAVRGLIRGTVAPSRAGARPTAEQQRIMDEGTTTAMRAAAAATEAANRPASGGGGGGNVEAVHQRAVARVAELEHLAKARIQAELDLARQLDESATAEKNLTVARAIAAHELVDTERRGRIELLGLARDRREAEIGLADAEGNGDDARRARVGELANLRTALQGMLAETTARIEAAQAEHRSQAEMNDLLRERIGIQQSLAQTTTALTEVQRANGAALGSFRDAMVQQASGVADAFGAATAAALDSQQSFGAALAAALRDQLKALTKEAVVMSLKNLALGTAALFTNPVAAPGFFAAAGLWGAVGIAAGAGYAATAPSKPATPSGSAGASSDRAASARPATAASESSGPLTLQINVSGAMFNEGVEESIVRGLDRAHARGLSPRFARGN